MAQLLQGWAKHISFCADHTYVACPEAGDEFFDCWGEPSGTGPDRVLICEGEGNYPVANCYRCSLEYEGKIYPDTACIGIYALNGVCHQSANCFLFTAGVTLTFEVRGYWFTELVYGTYGDFFAFWAKLAQCSLAGGVQVPETGAIAVDINPSLPNQIRSLYEAAATEGPTPSRNEMLIREADHDGQVLALDLVRLIGRRARDPRRMPSGTPPISLFTHSGGCSAGRFG